MGRIQSHRDLIVWQKAMDLAVSVYRLCSSFPPDERFRLTSQITRAACSVPANIAEGCGRGSNADLARFLQIALGSTSELENHLLLAKDLRILQPADHNRLSNELVELRRMLATFVKSLKAFANNP